VRQLAERHAGRPALVIDDEYDVQDHLHALLRLHLDDVREEEWAPSYGGSRIDFLLKRERMVVETKMTRDRLDRAKVVDELVIDKAHYRQQPDCKTLVCFVYDPDHRLANPDALESAGARAAFALRPGRGRRHAKCVHDRHQSVRDIQRLVGHEAKLVRFGFSCSAPFFAAIEADARDVLAPQASSVRSGDQRPAGSLVMIPTKARRGKPASARSEGCSMWPRCAVVVLEGRKYAKRL
jgi:REase_DpnII-MboI